MNKEKFIQQTLRKLFEESMPPGMEKAKRPIKERYNIRSSDLNQMAWEIYEYSEEDRPKISEKLRVAAASVLVEMKQTQTELGLLTSPDEEDFEIERVFRAKNEPRALQKAIEWADTEGYNVEEPPEGSESASDYRIDGRRLTLLRR